MTGKWYKISAHKVDHDELVSWLTEHIGLENWIIRSEYGFGKSLSDPYLKKYYWVKIKNKKKAFLFLLTFR